MSFFAIAGCAPFYSEGGGDSRQKLEAKFEKLVADREYHDALNLLGRMDKAEPIENYETRRQKIRGLAEAFAADVEEKASIKAQKGDFLMAVNLVELALRKTPNNKTLLRLQLELTQERDRRLAANQRALVAGEAEHLWANLESYNEKAKLVVLSGKTERRRDKIQERLTGLHHSLIDCGRDAIELEDYETAERCLSIAAKIKNSDRVLRFKSRLKERLVAEEETAGGEKGAGDSEPVIYLAETNKVRPPEAISASFRKLEKKLREQLDDNEISDAQNSIEEMEKLAGRRKEIEKYRQQLDAIKRKIISRKMEQASELYRHGRIKAAREIWRQILDLDPENKLATEKIARADKVLASIRDLKRGDK